MLNQNKIKETKKTLIEITVIGKDRKGVVAESLTLSLRIMETLKK